MKRKRVETAPSATAYAVTTALADELREAVEGLRRELAELRASIDELVVEVQWANRNAPERNSPWKPIRPITSMPLDPCADDWAESLNQYGPRDIPADPSVPPDVRRTAKSGRLF